MSGDGAAALAPASGSGNQVAPEPATPLSIVAEIEAHLEVLFKLARQLPSKRVTEPETEGTVFQRFLGAISQNVRHLKSEQWPEEEMAKLPREAQVERFAEVFHVGRVYSEFFGGGAAMSEVALQEFASLRAQALQTEQTVKTLYEHVQRPQQGRPLPHLVNFGGQIRGAQPRVFGAAAGKFYQEQGQLTFLNHTIREGEEFDVAEHSNALSTLADCGWETEPALDAVKATAKLPSDEGEDGGEQGEGDSPPPEPLVHFAHVAHQFKTMCFAYSLLQASSISLNIYNLFFFFPRQTNWFVVLACIFTQFAAPFFLVTSKREFIEFLWPDEERDSEAWGVWDFSSVVIVIMLFDTINAEIFSKQIKNSLLTLRLRNIVWNSSRDWQGTLMLAFDLYANVINPCVTAIVINLVLFSSGSDVLDSILNALALNFIIEVDEYVLKADMDDAALAHQEDLPLKIVRFLLGDPRMACTYYLSDWTTTSGAAARKALQNDIKRPARLLIPLLMLSFVVPFITFLSLRIRWMLDDE